MAVSLDATSTSLSAGVETSRSWSHTVGTAKGGRLLIVTVSTGNTALSAGVAVTYGGVAMTLGVSITEASTYYLRAEIYYLVNPPTGSNTVAVTWTNSTSGAFSAMSFYGVSRNTPIFSTSPTTQSVTTGNPSLSVPGMSGGIAIDALAMDNTDTGLTVGASQTQVVNSSTWHGASSYEPWSTGTTIAMTWTKTVGRNHVGAGLSLVPGSAMGSPAVSPFLRF